MSPKHWIVSKLWEGLVKLGKSHDYQTGSAHLEYLKNNGSSLHLKRDLSSTVFCPETTVGKWYSMYTRVFHYRQKFKKKYWPKYYKIVPDKVNLSKGHLKKMCY